MFSEDKDFKEGSRSSKGIVATVQPTELGRIASFYYLSYKTPNVVASGMRIITENTSVKKFDKIGFFNNFAATSSYDPDLVVKSRFNEDLISMLFKLLCIVPEFEVCKKMQ